MKTKEENTVDPMMPLVGEKLDEYMARHLGAPINLYRRMTENQREDEWGRDKLNELAYHFHSWKDGIKSRMRELVHVDDMPIERVIGLFNPQRIGSMKPPKALDPLPGQADLPFPETAGTEPPKEQNRKRGKRRRS